MKIKLSTLLWSILFALVLFNVVPPTKLNYMISLSCILINEIFSGE